MYSAQGLADGLFSEDDLPDSLFLQPFDNSAVDGSYTGEEIFRNGTTYGPSEHSNQTIQFVADFFGRPIWGMFTNDDLIFDLDCLFDEVSFEFSYPESVDPKDLFKDTYSVTTNQSSGTVTRESLCVWRGADNNGCSLLLEYIGPNPPPNLSPEEIPSANVYKWFLSWAEGGIGTPCDERARSPKSGLQNTPVGEYASGQYPNPITVSEP